MWQCGRRRFESGFLCDCQYLQEELKPQTALLPLTEKCSEVSEGRENAASYPGWFTAQLALNIAPHIRGVAGWLEYTDRFPILRQNPAMYFISIATVLRWGNLCKRLYQRFCVLLF